MLPKGVGAAEGAVAAQAMRFAGIVAMAWLGALAYGVLLELGTLLVCPEYVSAVYPELVPAGSDSLPLVGRAAAWGVVATLLPGLLLGLGLAACARLGPAPRRSLRSLVRPLLVVLGTGLSIAVALGLSGLILALGAGTPLPDELAAAVPAEAHSRLAVAWFGHSGGFIGGLIGAAALMALVTLRRLKEYRRDRPLTSCSGDSIRS